MVRSILLRAGLVRVFLVQAFSLFGPADGLPVHCFQNPTRLNQISSISGTVFLDSCKVESY